MVIGDRREALKVWRVLGEDDLLGDEVPGRWCEGWGGDRTRGVDLSDGGEVGCKVDGLPWWLGGRYRWAIHLEFENN